MTSVAATHRLPLTPYALYGDKFYHYQGGLTTPPCTEIVSWNLASQLMMVSVAQYQAVMKILLSYRDSDCQRATVAFAGSTSRPTQEINGREIKHICPATV